MREKREIVEAVRGGFGGLPPGGFRFSLRFLVQGGSDVDVASVWPIRSRFGEGVQVG